MIHKSIFFLLILVLLLAPRVFTKPAYATSTVTIDIFTQKQPYDGHGTNQPSDAFVPREELILYALIFNDSFPVNNQEVIFDVYGPANPPYYNNTFSLTALTNASGVATTSFVLPWAPQSFGEWTIYAKANISGTYVQDFTWFTVYWVVEIVWIETGILNAQWTREIVFAKGSFVDVKVVIENIAWVEKNVTLTATIYDSVGVPIAFSSFQKTIPPNSTKTLYIENLFIPKWAFSCNGNVMVMALAPAGEAYSPEKNQAIKITPCYYVGGINVASEKNTQSLWILGVSMLVMLVLILNIAWKKPFRNLV